MKKIKKIITLILTGTLCLSSLAGCSVMENLMPPTAESLMENPFKEEVKSAEFDFDFAFEVTGKENVEGTEMSMTVGMDMDANVEFDEDTTHAKGEIAATLMGMTFSEKMETYTQKEKDTVVTYTLNEDEWIVSEDDYDEKEDESFKGMLRFKTEIIKDLTLEKAEKDDKDYVVTGNIDFEDMAEGMDIMDMMEDMTEDIDMDDVVYHMTATFDKETRVLKSIKYVVDTEGLDNEDFEIDKMEIEITINEINGIEVEVPGKVEKMR